MRTSRRQALLVAGGVLALTSTVLVAPSSSTPVAHGCAMNRVPVAFHSDGTGASAGDLLTCVSRTGFGGAESHIRVAPNGDVVQEPGMEPLSLPSYMQAGLAVTRDDGTSWTLTLPNGASFQPQDNAIHIDRRTGRLYLVLSSGLGVDIAGETELLTSPASPTGYTQWTTTPLHGFVGAENSRFASAPAPAGQPAAKAGEDVGYWCGNQNAGVTSPVILDRTCFRTLDGGATWQQASVPFVGGVSQYPECSSAPGYSAGDGSYPQAAPDGALWVLVECDGKTFLSRSVDEAATFPIVHRPNGGAPLAVPFAPSPSGASPETEIFAGLGLVHHELRVDEAGNLYAFEAQGAALLMRISRDRGLTWSTPLNLTVPGARKTALDQWQVAVRGVGRVAASYLMPHAGTGRDGYLTVTSDALAANPVFYGAMVNAASGPLVSAGGAGDDFIDLDLAPDGTAWAAFYADCPSDGSDGFCTKSEGSPVPEHLQYNEQTGPQAEVIARLAPPRTTPRAPRGATTAPHHPTTPAVTPVASAPHGSLAATGLPSGLIVLAGACFAGAALLNRRQRRVRPDLNGA